MAVAQGSEVQTKGVTQMAKAKKTKAKAKKARKRLAKTASKPSRGRVKQSYKPKAALVGVKSQPVSGVFWMPRSELKANDYNPNTVPPRELELLKHSILTDGWTQPIVAMQDLTIVDGFHRYAVAEDSQVAALTNGKVPVVIVKGLGRPDAIAATVRHNRARGVHGIMPMAELVQVLGKLGVDQSQIQVALGMTAEEAERLLLQVPAIDQGKGKDFGKAWQPEFEGRKP